MKFKSVLKAGTSLRPRRASNVNIDCNMLLLQFFTKTNSQCQPYEFAFYDTVQYVC